MKNKLLIVQIVIGVLLIVITSAVSANGGPHGGFDASTDGCAGCHRAHTATGANLLVNTSTNGLCLTCHGAGSTGALTNVSHGVLEVTAGSNVGTTLVGGGFNFVSGAAATSSHANVTNLSWGFGTAVRGTTADMGDTLDCGSCHDPHGNEAYRLLVSYDGGSSFVTDYDPAGNYSTENWTNLDLTSFCLKCHTTYMENSANTTHDVNVLMGLKTTSLPLANNGGTNNTLICSTCHYAHGTSAAAGLYSASGPSADSALLRMDNRDVCMDCHPK